MVGVRSSTVHSVPRPFHVRLLLLYSTGTLPETTFELFFSYPEALVKICFQNITLTNILVRLVN